MVIQYFSDIHLEFGGFEIPNTDADFVIAAGDISTGTEGLEWLKKFEKPVIYIAGNHEYYEGDLVHTREAIRAAALNTSVHFLDNESIKLNGVRFLGSTLWSDFNHGNAELMAHAKEGMNDYAQIRYDGEPLTPQHTLEAHRAAREWLDRELQVPFDGKTVVVTHHAPAYESWKQYAPEFYSHSYCSDMKALLDRYNIELWVHGHVHTVSDYVHNNVHIVCNPRGYTGFQNIAGFDAKKTIALT